jgi:hypothetical protein
MSRGSQVVTLRIPPLLLAAIDAKVKESVQTKKDEPYNRSTWILQCIMEKFNHLERSKSKCRKKKPASTSSTSGALVAVP